MRESQEKLILQAQNITKTFAAVTALDHVNLEIHKGKVNAIVGENGAGKSTLIKILSGVYQDYDGTVLLDGERVVFTNPKDAQDKGIAIIHQELNLIPYLSIAENIWLGREFLSPVGFIDYRKMLVETKKLLSRLDFNMDPKTLISELRVGQQQVVEIAKAISMSARIIMMDEPTSAITQHEVEVLFDLIRVLRDHGVAIVYITHKLDELFQVADHVTVLRDGRFIGGADIGDVCHDDIIRMMVGREIDHFFTKTEMVKGKEILRVKNLSLDHPERISDYLLKDVDFSVCKGEVLGIFGLMGAGRTELLETVFGVHSTEMSGTITVDGSDVLVQSPADAVHVGIGLIPEDRNLEGLVLLMSVAESISLASIQQVERFGFLDSGLEVKLAKQYIERLQIKASSGRQIVANLSGGNQQKVVIAKWLATEPKVLLMDEPTRGIDVGAKNEIYKLISELADSGLSIVVVSSELPEILAISDRIMVLSEGRKTGEFLRKDANEEILMKAAIPNDLRK